MEVVPEITGERRADQGKTKCIHSLVDSTRTRARAGATGGGKPERGGGRLSSGIERLREHQQCCLRRPSSSMAELKYTRKRGGVSFREKRTEKRR